MAVEVTEKRDYYDNGRLYSLYYEKQVDSQLTVIHCVQSDWLYEGEPCCVLTWIDDDVYDTLNDKPRWQ